MPNDEWPNYQGYSLRDLDAMVYKKAYTYGDKFHDKPAKAPSLLETFLDHPDVKKEVQKRVDDARRKGMDEMQPRLKSERVEAVKKAMVGIGIVSLTKSLLRIAKSPLVTRDYPELEIYEVPKKVGVV